MSMKRIHSLILTTVASSVVFAGCVYTPGGYFDPTGTWSAVNLADVTVTVDYTNRGLTSAYIDTQVIDDGATWFGTADAVGLPIVANDGIPVALLASDTVRVKYNYSTNVTQVNINGDNLAYNYVGVPATTGYSTTEVAVDPGYPSQTYNFLNSTGCYFSYNVFLGIALPSDIYMKGVTSTRFEFYNDFAHRNLQNPSCDEIFLSLQLDYNYNTQTYANDGLLYALTNYTYDSYGYSVSAVDVTNIKNILGLQFDSYFTATRVSTIIKDRTDAGSVAPAQPSDEVALHSDALKNLITTPAKLFAPLYTAQGQARFASALEQVRSQGLVDENGKAVSGQSFPSIADKNVSVSEVQSHYINP